MAMRAEEIGAADDFAYLIGLGERERLDALYRAYRDDIYRLCERHLRNAADAEDATQEIMLKVAAKLPQYRRELAFQPWLRTISRNVCRDFQRSETRIVRIADRQAERHGALSLSTPAPDADLPEEEFRRRQNVSLVIEALLSLPESHRKMLYLQMYEGLSYDEIGRRMHRSRDSVRTAIMRAKKAVRLYLDELGADWSAWSFVGAAGAVLRRLRDRSRSWMLRGATKGSNVAADSGPMNVAIVARATEVVAAGIVALGALVLPHGGSSTPASLAAAPPVVAVQSPAAAVVAPASAGPAAAVPTASAAPADAPVAPARDGGDVTRVRVGSPDGSGPAYNASFGEEDRALRFKRGITGPLPVFGEDYESDGEMTIKCEGHPVGEAACDVHDRLPSGSD